MNHPKLSILTPTFRSGQFLRAALDSVDHPLIEHIVVDGGSDDGTVPLLREWRGAARYQDSRRWISEPDNGQSDALNKALHMASAPWIGWLNADERYLPGTLDHAIAAIGDDNYDVLYGNFDEIDTEGNLIKHVYQHPFNRTVLRSADCFIPSCATFLRARPVRQVGGFDPAIRTVMDQDLWLALDLAGARFKYVPTLVSRFTRHPDQATQQLSGRSDLERVMLRERYGLNPSRSSARMRRCVRLGLKATSGVRRNPAVLGGLWDAARSSLHTAIRRTK